MPVDNRGEVKAKFIRNLGYAKPAGVTDSVNDFSTQTFYKQSITFIINAPELLK